jgi:membrane protein DedA with SNARE-associated domain
LLSDLGYLGLVVLMIAETVFPPIPSEVVLPAAGLTAPSSGSAAAGQ